MDLTKIPVLSVLRSSMSWLTQRQQVLAENVANAATPGFRAKDLERPDFTKVLDATLQNQKGGQGTYKTTSRVIDSPDSVTSPDGNSVGLEEQMMRVSETQIQYQAAANIYKKSLNMLRIAVRGSR